MARRRRTFVTVDDVVTYLIELKPGFADDLTHGQLQDIVRANAAGRYEDITDDEIAAMYDAAMTETVSFADAVLARLARVTRYTPQKEMTHGR